MRIVCLQDLVGTGIYDGQFQSKSTLFKSFKWKFLTSCLELIREIEIFRDFQCEMDVDVNE